MKRNLLFFIVLVSVLVGCNEMRHRELFEKTDHFVESLNSTIQSYGLLGGQEYTEYAENGEYRILPMGRLINVRIEREASSNEYESLRSMLESHYSGDPRVNQVYICGGGTVMIDCRN
ncbi:MAG: ABC transporter [Prevotella sp.]|nr:ABC transporter [Prevotella sp.]